MNKDAKIIRFESFDDYLRYTKEKRKSDRFRKTEESFNCGYSVAIHAFSLNSNSGYINETQSTMDA
jgi:hypothetical protein